VRSRAHLLRGHVLLTTAARGGTRSRIGLPGRLLVQDGRLTLAVERPPRVAEDHLPAIAASAAAPASEDLPAPTPAPHGVEVGGRSSSTRTSLGVLGADCLGVSWTSIPDTRQTAADGILLIQRAVGFEGSPRAANSAKSWTFGKGEPARPALGYASSPQASR
jgi:hypothetical protein